MTFNLIWYHRTDADCYSLADVRQENRITDENKPDKQLKYHVKPVPQKQSQTMFTCIWLHANTSHSNNLLNINVTIELPS